MKTKLFAVLLSFLLVSSTMADDWQAIFDGKSLDDWKAADHDECFKVEDGAIVAGGGPMAHLFYVGPVGNHDFKNFELKIEVKTKPGSNGGIFFHAEPQSGFLKKGYEAQVIERWRREYNTVRPHSSLGYRPPAPEAAQAWSFRYATLREKTKLDSPDS